MRKFIFIILLLFSIHFWGFIYIPQIVNNITNSLAMLIMGISFIRTLKKDGMQFRNAIILFFFGILINIISAFINQGQDPLDTFLTFGTTYFFILFYFFLHYLQISRKFLENVIIIFAIIFSLFYILQLLEYPNMIFNSNMLEDRGTIRISIEGNGFLMMAYFLLLNRFLLNRRILNLLLAFVFFIILLLGGFRTLTLAALLLSGLMYIRLVKYSVINYTILVFMILFVMGLFQFQGTSKIINEMVSTSTEQKAEGSDYIRFRELNYYFNVYPQNKSYFIMGGGLPGTKSSYSNSMDRIEVQYGFYWDDLGLIGFYILIGAVALLGLLWYTIKAIFIKVPPHNIYISMYFIYLLIVSFTTREIYRTGIFAVEAIGLYLIDIYYFEGKREYIL